LELSTTFEYRVVNNII